MTTVLTLVILTLYLAFCAALGNVMYSKVKQWNERVKESMRAARERKPPINEAQDEIKRLKAQLEAKEAVSSPAMESI
jgi:hypothetical protein